MKIGMLVVSAVIGAWLTYEVVTLGVSPQRIVLLLYIALVIVTMLLRLVPEPTRDEKDEQKTGIKEDREGPEEIVLNVIRQRGKAKRADLLPRVRMSKTSLLRLLDQMEAKGLIRQVGERKSSYYVLAEK